MVPAGIELVLHGEAGGERWRVKLEHILEFRTDCEP
jgi:hypothetical protein